MYVYYIYTCMYVTRLTIWHWTTNFELESKGARKDHLSPLPLPAFLSCLQFSVLAELSYKGRRDWYDQNHVGAKNYIRSNWFSIWVLPLTRFIM